MAILFYDESMTIDFSGKDQRGGKECPPLSPKIEQVNQDNVRPRGANIIDFVQDGDSITITANGNGTGTVKIVAYQEKDSSPVLGVGVDERSSQGCFETSVLGSKSVINSLSPVISEEVTVLAAPMTVDLDQEINEPDKDCLE